MLTSVLENRQVQPEPNKCKSSFQLSTYSSHLFGSTVICQPATVRWLLVCHTGCPTSQRSCSHCPPRYSNTSLPIVRLSQHRSRIRQKHLYARTPSSTCIPVDTSSTSGATFRTRVVIIRCCTAPSPQSVSRTSELASRLVNRQNCPP